MVLLKKVSFYSSKIKSAESFYDIENRTHIGIYKLWSFNGVLCNTGYYIRTNTIRIAEVKTKKTTNNLISFKKEYFL